MHRLQRPEAVGLYDPNFEHDNCGIGAVACLTGNASHRTVQRALDVLDHLEHRGATGAELETGDGAGILLQTPHDLFEEVTDFELPPPGRYAAGMVFLPKEPGLRGRIEKTIEQAIEQHGQTLLGWRDVPVDHDVPGASAAAVEPTIRQVFIRAAESLHEDQDAFGDDLQTVIPVVDEVGSDSAIFDNVLELLVLAGRSLPHALMMMIPEAWEGRDDMPAHLKDFYAYHSCLMEPWDGPAAVAFT